MNLKYEINSYGKAIRGLCEMKLDIAKDKTGIYHTINIALFVIKLAYIHSMYNGLFRIKLALQLPELNNINFIFYWYLPGNSEITSYFRGKQ
jgi:hypothetical protein